MSDLIFYITSIAFAFGPITVASASAAALYIIRPRGAFRSAGRAFNNVDPTLEPVDELVGHESGAQLVD
jgi:hypothetical protein